MTNKKVESLERVIDVAADFFLAHRLEDVSMATIAKAAHCSTTTMYSTYESKEKLFIAALSSRLKHTPILRAEGDSSFLTLLRYAHARITLFSDPDFGAVMRAVVRQPEIMRRSLSEMIAKGRTESDAALRELIAAAFQEGILRPAPAEAILDIFKSMTTQETILNGLLYGPERQVFPRRILLHLFEPLVNEEGRRILLHYLGEHFPC